MPQKRSDLLNYKIEINRMQSEMRSKSTISECFHFDHSQCKGKIKKAHSIQRNGRLSLLAENVNGNSSLYSFIEFELNETTGLTVLKPIGIASASTFMGFCDFHDKVLFSEIEDNSFKDNEEHCFLHSYRAFSYSHHGKIEQAKGLKSESKFNHSFSNYIPTSLYGTEIGLNDGKLVRSRLNELLQCKNYSELETYTLQFADFYPIASSSALTPKYSPKSKTKLNLHMDEKIPYEYVFFNIIPDKNGTIVILACLPENKKSVKYIDEFSSLNIFNQRKILTSTLIGEVENTFISPYIYNNLSQNEKYQLIRELSETSIYSLEYQTKEFTSKLNFFENKFIKT